MEQNRDPRNKHRHFWWDLIKLRNLLGRGNHKKCRQLMEWEKIVATDKGLISKIYKKLIKLNSKKPNPLEKICRRLK